MGGQLILPSFVDACPGVLVGEVVVLCPTSSGCQGSTGSGPTPGGFENAPRAPLGLELVLNPATVFRKKSANRNRREKLKTREPLVRFPPFQISPVNNAPTKHK